MRKHEKSFCGVTPSTTIPSSPPPLNPEETFLGGAWQNISNCKAAAEKVEPLEVVGPLLHSRGQVTSTTSSLPVSKFIQYSNVYMK